MNPARGNESRARSAGAGQSGPRRESGQAAYASTGSSAGGGEGDEHGADRRIPWFLIMVLSYSSAVTLALAWVLLAGRSFRTTEEPARDASPSPGERASKPDDSKAARRPACHSG